MSSFIGLVTFDHKRGWPHINTKKCWPPKNLLTPQKTFLPFENFFIDPKKIVSTPKKLFLPPPQIIPKKTFFFNRGLKKLGVSLYHHQHIFYCITPTIDPTPLTKRLMYSMCFPMIWLMYTMIPSECICFIFWLYW